MYTVAKFLVDIKFYVLGLILRKQLLILFCNSIKITEEYFLLKNKIVFEKTFQYLKIFVALNIKNNVASFLIFS